MARKTIKNVIKTILLTLVLVGGIFAQKTLSSDKDSCCCLKTPITISGKITPIDNTSVRNIRLLVVELEKDGSPSYSYTTFTGAFGNYIAPSTTCVYTVIQPYLVRTPSGYSAVFDPPQIFQEFFTDETRDFTVYLQQNPY